MTDLIIGEPYASQIRKLAEREQLELDAVIARMIENYPSRRSPLPPIIPVYEPRPKSSLPDDLIDVPDDIEDKNSYRDATRAMRPKLYEIAREYWQKTGNTERLALSDEQLDKVFWLIDHEGMPRFLEEKAIYTPPPDPLEALIGLFSDSDVTDASTTVRETMAKKYDSSA
jgi:hypothetical protein